jgi:hypothetical protein
MRVEISDYHEVMLPGYSILGPLNLPTLNSEEPISIELSEDTITGLAFINGHGYRIGQVSSFVRIPIGYIDLFGIVSQVGASALPERLAASELHGRRWMTVQLIGERYQRGEFKRGLSQFPTIGDTAHIVTEQDLARIYGRPDAPNFVKIGHLASAESIPALIDINKLITRHSAVVGATGAGKSTTVAGLLLSLSDKKKYPSARIIIIDIHGEYSAALNDHSTVFRINPNVDKDEEPLFVPYWAMTFDELLPITLGSLDDASRGALLEKIRSLKLVAVESKPMSEIETRISLSKYQTDYDRQKRMGQKNESNSSRIIKYHEHRIRSRYSNP